jgi:glc operon protein GlcG
LLSWEIAVRKTLLAAAVLLASSVAFESQAQPIFLPRKQVSPEAARKLVDACTAYARANNAIVGVAVVDFAGVLIDMHLMQGGTATYSETAILKAKTAAHWQRATSQLEEDVNSKRNGASAWIGDFPRAGGIPIVIEGEVAGAIGVGGGGAADACAQAAIDSVIGKPAQAAQR